MATRVLLSRLGVCLVVGALAAGLLTACQKKAKSADLIIISPHPDAARKEFAAAFSKWHEDHYGTPATVEYRDLGGGTTVTKAIRSLYGHSSASSGIDVYFGGGAPDHQYLAGEGCIEKIELPAELLAQIPQTINGVRQYDANAGWYGACISSFGILYNAQLLNELNAKGAADQQLPTPRRWADLADPRFNGLLIAAGPESSSGRACYELILQSAGKWTAGWKRLLGFWANCQGFTAGASDLPTRVHNGQALAATCIDFYAFGEIATAGEGQLKFVLPEDGVVWTPDPVSVLKGAPHREMARKFVEFVLSVDGQALWCLPAGTPGGPVSRTLFRQPINRLAYERYGEKFPPQLVNVNPSNLTGIELDANLQAMRVPKLLPKLMQAAAIDNGAFAAAGLEADYRKGLAAPAHGRVCRPAR